MKLPVWFSGLLIAVTLSFVGCKKANKTAAPYSSVRVIDATRLRPAFASAGPQIEAIVNDVMTSIQEANYRETLAGLDKLAALPGLSDAQKKVVADLTEQIKKKMSQ